MRKLIIIIGFLCSLHLVQATNGYKTPPDLITQIATTPATPYLQFVSCGNHALEWRYQNQETLEQLADPVDKLAGQVISKQLHAPATSYPDTALTIHNVQTGKKLSVTLPAHCRIRSKRLSYDQKQLAIAYETEDGIRLGIVSMQTGIFQEIPKIRINDMFETDGFTWLPDHRTIVAKSIIADRKPPQKPLVPNAPITDETSGQTSAVRTYQNLLETPYDQQLFTYYATSQLVRIDTKTQKIKPIGQPAAYDEVEPSPNGDFLLVSRIEQPYSYTVPYYRFPTTFAVLDQNGRQIHVIHHRPLQEEIPIGGVVTGPRYIQWQANKSASLIWPEALDEGNPKNKVLFRDAVYGLAAPFNQKPELLFQTEHRFYNIHFGEQANEIVYYQYDRDRLWYEAFYWKIGAKQLPKLLFSLNRNDEYGYPGELVLRKAINGHKVFLSRDRYLYLQNPTGATSEGNFPFLSRMSLETGKTEMLWRCQENHWERFYGFIGDDLKTFAIRSETSQTPPNYYLVDRETDQRQALTHFANPYPEVTGLRKELIRYTRNDSIPLSGTLYYPLDYQPGKRYPLIIHAYPEEYNSAATAGQLSGSEHQFIRLAGSSVRFLALQDYMVLYNASIPIVGDPETVNNTFIEQLNASVAAAIDYLDQQQLIDPQCVGIYGHSYGAFMVANALAHSDLCAIGIARSGAYNRTLTPFGFQSERRTLWEVPDFYTHISPFMQADKINEPLLLIHGAEDPNSGTYPMQSKRMFQALKGNGGTARLVMLPFEGHGYRAQQSQLHVLAEMIEWCDRFLKNKNDENLDKGGSQ